jgi:hypothetical protein
MACIDDRLSAGVPVLPWCFRVAFEGEVRIAD